MSWLFQPLPSQISVGGGGAVNTSPPVIARNSGYAGDYAGSKYTVTSVGIWTGGGAVTGNWQSNGVNIPGATGLTHTLTFAQEGLSLRYQETNTGVTANSNSFTRPALTNLLTDKLSRPPPTTNPRPAYLVPYTDPTFGTKITRISGDPGTPIGSTGGTWGTLIHHQYHKFPVWNADETMMFIETNSGGAVGSMVFLDGQTYQPISSTNPRPSGWVEGRWDRNVPNRMVYVTGNSIFYYNVLTGVSTLLHSWSGTYYNMYIGALKGEQSWDNDVFPIKAKRVVDDKNVVFLYTISTDSINQVNIPEDRFGHAMTLGQVNCSPLKTCMYVNFDDETTVILSMDGVTILATWPEAQWPAHNTLCVDRNDNLEYAWGAHSGDIVKRRLPDGASTTLNTDSYGYHTSATNYIRGKWITNDYVDDSGVPYVGEQVIIAHDGSVVGRLCHNQRGSQIDYDNEPHGSISPTGKRIIFASTWRGAGTPSRPVGIYVCDFRDRALPGAEVGAVSTPKTVNITVTTTVSQLRQMGKRVTIAVTGVVSSLKLMGKVVNIESDLVISLNKAMGKRVNITSTTSMALSALKGLGTNFTRLVSITATTSVGVVGKSVGKSVNITATSTVAMLRAMGKRVNINVITSTFVTIAGQVVPIPKLINITATTSVSMGRSVGKIIEVPVAAIVAIRKNLAQTVSIVVHATVTKLRSSAHVTTLPLGERILRAKEALRIIFAR